MIGIYKITSPSSRIYIGQSIDIEKRLNKYRKLYSSVTGQTRLYNSLLKYGYESHKVEIIEECSVSQLNERERFYQDLFEVIGKNGLNCLLTKTSEKKMVMSEISIQKQKVKRIGIKIIRNKHSIETKNKISNALKGNKFNLGRKQTIESINKRLNKTNKIVLDLNTGIFYSSPLEYANLYSIKYNTLTCRLSGRIQNNTNLIYA